MFNFYFVASELRSSTDWQIHRLLDSIAVRKFPAAILSEKIGFLALSAASFLVYVGMR